MATANESNSLLETQEPKKRRLFPKWKLSMVFWLSGAGAVFITNLVIIVWAYLRVPNDDEIVPYNRNLYVGDCSKTQSLNTGFHLLINILSTLLLGATNFFMQRLLAPTREEVSQAHSKFRWLDIGILSLRNLKYISKLRVGLWSLLCLSSLSLHLFYNSSIYASFPNNSYFVYSVNEAFGQLNNNVSAQTNDTDLTNFMVDLNEIQWNGFENFSWYMTSSNDFNNFLSGSFNKLDPLQCLDAYAQDFQASPSDLFVVTQDNVSYLNSSLPAVLYAEHVPNPLPAIDPYSWICSQFPQTSTSLCSDHISSFKANISSWQPFGHQVDYCLTQGYVEIGPLNMLTGQCRVQLDLSVALIVGIVNLVQVILMCVSILGVRNKPLLTNGDAILSFLEDPDSTTQSMSLLEKSDVHRFKVPKKARAAQSVKWLSSPKSFVATRKRWHTAVGKGRWIGFAILYICLFTIGIFFFVYGLYGLGPGPSKYLSSLWKLGLGQHAMTVINFPGWINYSYGDIGLFQTALLANMAQPILSGLYILYNGILTSMVQAAEWSSYSVQQKGLRISTTTKGAQRSTYFLSLPYRYSVPLLIASALLHWLVSQSVFMLAINSGVLFYGDDGIDENTITSNYTCGYSPIAILLVLIFALLMATVAILLGFKRFKSGMPLVGSCSVAISAACHPVPGVEKRVFTDEPLTWGVMGVNVEGVAHCGFSSDLLEAPKSGILYA